VAGRRLGQPVQPVEAGPGAYTERRLREGKPWPVVMGAVARKLLGWLYVVLKENRPYDVR